MLTWSIEKQTTSAGLPVSVDMLKTNLRLPSDCNEHDSILSSKLRAAGEQVEYDTGQALLSADYVQRQNAFPSGSLPLQIQVRPLQSVSEFNYTDSSGNVQALVEGTDFTTDTSRQLLTPLADWPDGGSLEITVVAGYGTSQEDLPAWAVESILLQAGHWHIDPAMEVAEGYAHDKAYERIIHRRVDPTYPVP